MPKRAASSGPNLASRAIMRARVSARATMCHSASWPRLGLCAFHTSACSSLGAAEMTRSCCGVGRSLRLIWSSIAGQMLASSRAWAMLRGVMPSASAMAASFQPAAAKACMARQRSTWPMSARIRFSEIERIGPSAVSASSITSTGIVGSSAATQAATRRCPATITSFLPCACTSGGCTRPIALIEASICASR